VLACVALAPVNSLARLGDSAATLKKRFGRPEAQPAKNQLVWLIEEPAGALIYNVTLNERGVSIAEGLKPYRAGGLSESSARNFIADQISVLTDPTTARRVKAGESYQFGGETLTCGANEHIVVDDRHNLLVVWTKGSGGHVLAASHEFLHATRP
jgi:hypothetical protein